jgi:acyl CoA:acetate/3-ketoacid CoA transferase beta subunit
MDSNLFTGTGVPALAAQEMAAQVTAGVGNPDRLLAAGMSAQDAQAVAAMINASQSSAVVLASASGIGGI